MQFNLPFMKYRSLVVFSIFVFCFCCIQFSNAQAPSISYPTGNKVYTVGAAITSLSPNNAGGIVGVNVTTFYKDYNGENSVATDATGNIYLLNNDNVINKLSSGGVILDSWYLNNLIGGSFPGVFDGVAVDNDGNIYTGNWFYGGIFKKTPKGLTSTISSKLILDRLPALQLMQIVYYMLMDLLAFTSFQNHHLMIYSLAVEGLVVLLELQ